MDADRIEMSQRDRERLMVMTLVLGGKRLHKEGASLLKLSARQVRRRQRRL